MKENNSTEILIPAVIYARYSSSGQREESIEGQIRECKEFAKRNGFRIVGEYADKAISGRTDKRPDFQRMLKDAEKELFQAVICWKVDRFARNRYDSAMYKYRLKKNGIRIYYAKESIPEGPEGIILESVMEGYAEYYSENLSQNVKRGYYDSALEFKTLGVRVYGLRKDSDGRFEQDPVTAPVVKRIFKEYISGKSSKEIYTELNNEGYKTSTGGAFNKNSINRIIQNKKYIGIYEFKDIYAEDIIPAIIDKEIFYKAQAILKLHKKSPAAKVKKFLLTSKLYCGNCGKVMTGDSGTSRSGKVHYYYACTNRRNHKCHQERIKKELIEKFVVDKLTELIHSDEFIYDVAQRCIDFQSTEKDTSVINILEENLKNTEKSIKNIIDAIEAGIITPSTKNRLLELEKEKTAIENGIAKQLIENPELEKEQIIYFLEQFRSGETDDEKYKIFIVDTFLNKVFLYDDKIVFVLNYTDNNNKEITLNVVNTALINNINLFRFSSTHSVQQCQSEHLKIIILENVIIVVYNLSR